MGKDCMDINPWLREKWKLHKDDMEEKYVGENSWAIFPILASLFVVAYQSSLQLQIPVS